MYLKSKKNSLGEVSMAEVEEVPGDTSPEEPEIHNEAVVADEKMAKLEKMLEEFKSANPVKNKKKFY